MKLDKVSNRMKLHFEDNWGFFVGAFADNVPHRHFALQVSIALEGALKISHGEVMEAFSSCLIQSNVPHQFSGAGYHLTILVNPVSSVGHYLAGLAGEQEEMVDFTNAWSLELKQAGLAYVNGALSGEELVAGIRQEFEKLKCRCAGNNHFADERISKAINYLEQHAQATVPLETIAAVCFLSPSRFLHLFKEKTGISYRRMQLWNKTVQAFRLAATGQNLTQVAHACGFTDSAHLSRTFKETFGLSPKALLKG